jgi:hypothetical protein
MSAQGVLALGVILAVLLLMLMLRPRRAVGSGDAFADARDLIGKEIDAHVDALAEGYLEAGAAPDGDRPGTDHFSQKVELFIAQVLGRRAEHGDWLLRDALREILVLERDAVYAQVRERVEAYLRQPFPVEGRAPPPDRSGI